MIISFGEAFEKETESAVQCIKSAKLLNEPLAGFLDSILLLPFVLRHLLLDLALDLSARRSNLCEILEMLESPCLVNLLFRR